ncbi:spermatogenesis-associated protein 45-like [Megalops cyprinoides]|uniref:spermatogenesis-associated protein 45-like n=1 Tax=Megalops cyprinoides TaxID=118141 RepID=UPI001864B978|nr:spermatogenesis-associated protein 45-like [Megalops cyprinoides]
MSNVKAKDNALYELNMQRETWCCVEVDSKFWVQAERRHFAHHLQTTFDFKSLHDHGAEQRSSWMGGVSKLPERKHFAESYKAHLV